MAAKIHGGLSRAVLSMVSLDSGVVGTIPRWDSNVKLCDRS